MSFTWVIPYRYYSIDLLRLDKKLTLLFSLAESTIGIMCSYMHPQDMPLMAGMSKAAGELATHYSNVLNHSEGMTWVLYCMH